MTGDQSRPPAQSFWSCVMTWSDCAKGATPVHVVFCVQVSQIHPETQPHPRLLSTRLPAGPLSEHRRSGPRTLAGRSAAVLSGAACGGAFPFPLPSWGLCTSVAGHLPSFLGSPPSGRGVVTLILKGKVAGGAWWDCRGKPLSLCPSARRPRATWP